MSNYNYDEMRNIMRDSIRILKHGVEVRDAQTGRWTYNCQPRTWFSNLAYRFHIHDAVWDAVYLTRPRDWQQLVLEYPHRAETDHNRIAYTRDERAGESDKQTVTTIGKYLMRHFDLPDHEIRDIVARHTCNDMMYFVHTVDEMVTVVNSGPHSCMKWDSRSYINCDDGIKRHPYAVYDPKYGWHMAVRKDGAAIVGRALCVDTGSEKYWVRSFKKGENYSYSDEVLEAWLKSQGYHHEDGYLSGQKLALIPAECGFLAPYIDGDVQDVTRYSSHLEIESRGEYTCNETQGYVSDTSKIDCEDCGERIDEDEAHSVGRYEDRSVCQCCREDNYTECVSRHGRWRLIHNDDVVYVESQDQHYDTDYLDANGIVELENGDYEKDDNAVEVNDEWYHVDDERLVVDYDCVHRLLDECVEMHDGRYALEDECVELHDGRYALSDECWKCAGSGNWYHNDIDHAPIIVTAKYHPDFAPEQAEVA
jgi:hypothetical protein